MIKLLTLGDVVGKAGTELLCGSGLQKLRARYTPDLVIVNGENAAEGNGLSRETAMRLYDAGADVLTGGNHTLRRRDLYSLLDDGTYAIRPANYPPVAPGLGYVTVTARGYRVLVANVAGCVFMEPLASPFETMDRILQRESGSYDLAVCDIHAEATSEKLAFARYFDGRLAAIWGTHTHVATADETILPGGTGYITDLGMCGSHAGILGVSTDAILHKYLVKTPVQFQPAQGEEQLHGALFTLEESSGKCIAVERITE